MEESWETPPTSAPLWWFTTTWGTVATGPITGLALLCSPSADTNPGFLFVNLALGFSAANMVTQSHTGHVALVSIKN